MTAYYKASARSSARIRSIKPGKIALRGMLFSSCAVFSKPNNGNRTYNYDVFKLWPDLAGITTHPNRSYANSSSTTYYDAYWQTLCSSILPDRSDLSGIRKLRTSNYSHQRSWYETWWNAYKTKKMTHWDTIHANAASSAPTNFDATGADILAFGNFVHTATAMRKLFVSIEEGWLGLAPMDAEVGDRIALLEGGVEMYRTSCGRNWARK
jgi:hypothetical protein